MAHQKFFQRLEEKCLFYDFDKDNSCYKIHIPVTVDDNDDCFFICPFCVDKYKICGSEYKSAKPITHHHRFSGGGTRARHCRWEALKLFDCPPFEFNLQKRAKPRCEKCRYIDRANFINTSYMNTLKCTC